MSKTAYFAGGCFWCIAPFFDEIDGVASVVSGYCGGDEENPTYEQVKSQQTGHRETICIEYDPEKVPFTQLLDVFLECVDPFDAGASSSTAAVPTRWQSIARMMLNEPRLKKNCGNWAFPDRKKSGQLPNRWKLLTRTIRLFRQRRRGFWHPFSDSCS